MSAAATTQSEIGGYADWKSWDPKDYLTDYYGEVMANETYAPEFLVEAMRRVGNVEKALEFGCGPTVHLAFALVPKAGGIHIAGYLAANRAEVEGWLRSDNTAHDWSAFAVEILRLEGNGDPTVFEIEQKERETRARVTRVLHADANQENPLDPESRGTYPIVTSHYCAEGATSDKPTWLWFMKNICGLVAPGGTIILSACGAADHYTVGEHRFPCAGVTAEDVMQSLLENGFGELDLRVRHVPDHSSQGYGSVIFAAATKRTEDSSAEPGEGLRLV